MLQIGLNNNFWCYYLFRIESTKIFWHCIVFLCMVTLWAYMFIRHLYVFQEAFGHEGAKPQKAIYLRNGRLLTVGFSRMSERQYALRKEVSILIFCIYF